MIILTLCVIGSMEFEELNKIIKTQIQEKPNLKQGWSQLVGFSHFSSFNIDLEETQKEFEEWLLEVIQKEPIPSNISSLYFGLSQLSFPQIDNGKEKFTIYLAGSTLTPSQDEDWACETEYLPERRYLLLESFEEIEKQIKTLKNYQSEMEVLLFNGLLNLLIINSIQDFKDSILTYTKTKLGLFKSKQKREAMYIGSGFDSGDIYVVSSVK